LERSLSGVVAVADERVVGRGRFVGDGVKYFYIQDVAVIPEHRGQGVGQAIIDRLLLHVARTAPSTAFVGLFSTEQAASVMPAGHSPREIWLACSGSSSQHSCNGSLRTAEYP
jgi:GNAT superfamily N-acetyltransferase